MCVSNVRSNRSGIATIVWKFHVCHFDSLYELRTPKIPRQARACGRRSLLCLSGVDHGLFTRGNNGFVFVFVSRMESYAHSLMLHLAMESANAIDSNHWLPILCHLKQSEQNFHVYIPEEDNNVYIQLFCTGHSPPMSENVSAVQLKK